MDGTGSGLKIFYNNKVGDDESKSYVLKVVETSKGKYSVKETKGGKQSDSEVDDKGLVAMVRGNKQLGDFGSHVVNYLTKERGTYKGAYGGSKKSKKASKKASKKSHKTQEGGAKKKSKKASKKSKKASKKSKKAHKGDCGGQQGGAKKKSKKAS